jgi:hypothetical protein
MSPRRGDRVTVPPPQDQWDVRFATSDAATGWEVTSGGRVRYAIDDDNRTVWLVYASPRHPKDTDG